MNIQDCFPLGIDWFDLLSVWRILKSLLQHHILKVQFEENIMVLINVSWMNEVPKTMVSSFWGVKTSLRNISMKRFPRKIHKHKILYTLIYKNFSKQQKNENKKPNQSKKY